MRAIVTLTFLMKHSIFYYSRLLGLSLIPLLSVALVEQYKYSQLYILYTIYLLLRKLLCSLRSLSQCADILSSFDDEDDPQDF